jgi:hypothetical protein
MPRRRISGTFCRGERNWELKGHGGKEGKLKKGLKIKKVLGISIYSYLSATGLRFFSINILLYVHAL